MNLFGINTGGGNATATIGAISNTLQALGLTSWQMQEASWNGYPFTTISQFSNITFGSGSFTGLGIAGTAVGAASNIYSSVKQLAGLGGDTDVPSGANLAFSSLVDDFNRKIAINDIPNSKDNIRGLGYNGQTITMLGMAWGANYFNAVNNNLRNMFFSDEVISPKNKNYHVLVHPFFGTIQGAWLTNLKIIHQYDKWRACIYQLTFRTEQAIGINKKKKSIFSQISDAINAGISIASSINNLWSSYQLIFQRNSILKPQSNNALVIHQVLSLQKNIINSNNNTIATIKLLTRNLAPIGYNNVQLNNLPNIVPTLPELTYFTNHSTPQDVNNLITYLNRDIDATIANIKQTGTNYFNDTINLLQAAITNTGSLALTLLQSYYGQIQYYRVEYDMSLFVACALNNLDYESNYQKILDLNQNKLFFLNKLTKGSIIILPLEVV